MNTTKEQLFHFQKKCCCYCERKMILFGKSHGALSMEQKRKIDPSGLECTKEHLTRLTDGGKNILQNYAAACIHCNQNRGNIPWNVYKQIRMMEIEMGLLK